MVVPAAPRGPWLADGEGWETERELGASPADFRLERFFAKYEFTARHLLCCSDVEPLGLAELLALGEESEATGDALELWRGLSLGYTETRGHPALLAEIAASYADDAPPPEAAASGPAQPISAEHVLECAPQEGVALALAALLKPGDSAVVVCPAYQSLAELALCRGARCYPWRARGGGGGCGGALTFEVDDLQEALARVLRETGRPAALIVTNFPHNPSGATLRPDEWARVLGLAAEGGSWLLSDEMYRGLEGRVAGAPPPVDGRPRPQASPLAAAATAYARGVSLSGLSKVYGLPGLRIGWLACPDSALLARMGALRDFTTICSSAPSQILALVALRNRAALRARARALVDDGEAAAAAFFESHAERFAYHAPVAGPIAFPALRAPSARAADAEAYCERLVTQHGARRPSVRPPAARLLRVPACSAPPRGETCRRLTPSFPVPAPAARQASCCCRPPFTAADSTGRTSASVSAGATAARCSSGGTAPCRDDERADEQVASIDAAQRRDGGRSVISYDADDDEIRLVSACWRHVGCRPCLRAECACISAPESGARTPPGRKHWGRAS